MDSSRLASGLHPRRQPLSDVGATVARVLADRATVFVASYNTRRATELCVRSLRRTIGREVPVVVGDSASADGSAEMLGRLAGPLGLTVDVRTERWHHVDWLDHWLATCPTRWAVFVDSDVAFRRSGWLDELTGTDAALVAAESLLEEANVVEPVDGKIVRLAARPSPWVMAVQPALLRPLGASFAHHVEEPADVPEGIVLYDTAGWVAEQARRAGCGVAVMPDEFRRAYRHRAGMSWRSEPSWRRRVGRWAIHLELLVRRLQSS